jgi:hypothetical protein
MEYDNKVVLDGKTYELGYPMGVVAIYQEATAAIERSRPRPIAADPPCLCGSPKSTHSGESLIRLGENQKLLCGGFRFDDPLVGDNLFRADSLMRAFPANDVARFLALLWAGLHKYDETNKQLVPPMPIGELGNIVGMAEVTQLFEKMVSTVAAYFPKAKPGPNA